MALIVEISNRWEYGLPREKTFIPFLVHPNFWTLNFRKGYYKTAYVSRSVNMSGGQLSVFLKKDSYNFFEILHEAKES